MGIDLQEINASHDFNINTSAHGQSQRLLEKKKSTNKQNPTIMHINTVLETCQNPKPLTSHMNYSICYYKLKEYGMTTTPPTGEQKSAAACTEH